MKHLDLFSGIGGFALAARWAGMKTVQFVEIEPFCQKVLAKNFPGVPIHDDIKSFRGERFRGIDLLTGGFPCQDVSIANPKGAGLDGERSGIWFEMLRTIREVMPRYVVVENVPNLLNRGMGTVLAGLSDAGYDAEWDVLSAADAGALHLRERVWIVAYPHNSRQSQLQGRICDVGRRYLNEIKTSDVREERIQREVQEEVQGVGGLSWGKNIRSVGDLRERRDIPEPLLSRDFYGLPDRVDRTSALGNAIVPQVVYAILKAIQEVDN